MLTQNQYNRKEDAEKMNEEKKKWFSKKVSKMNEFLHCSEKGSTHVTHIRGLLGEHHYLSHRY